MKQSPTLFNGVDWELGISRNMSAWHQLLSSEGNYLHMKDFGVDAKMETLFITVNGTESHIFMYESNLTQCSDAMLETEIKDVEAVAESVARVVKRSRTKVKYGAVAVAGSSG